MKVVFVNNGLAKDLKGNIVAQITQVYDQVSKIDRGPIEAAFKASGYRLYIYGNPDGFNPNGFSCVLYPTYELAEENLIRFLECNEYKILDDKLATMQ